MAHTKQLDSIHPYIEFFYIIIIPIVLKLMLPHLNIKSTLHFLFCSVIFRTSTLNIYTTLDTYAIVPNLIPFWSLSVFKTSSI